MRIHAAQSADRFLERDGLNLLPVKSYHVTRLAIDQKLNGIRPKSRCEPAVKGRGNAAPLNVSENGHARFKSRAQLNLPADHVTDTAETNGIRRVLHCFLDHHPARNRS